MIDTIVMIIPEHKFRISNHDRFEPSTRGLFKPPYSRLGSKGYLACVQNPTKKELKEGNYKPRLTVTKRMRKGGFSVVLKVEYSIPKLLFGNNFDELNDSDFEKVIEILHLKLSEMSIEVSKQDLREADIVGIHYGKNIVMTDYTTSYEILNSLRKINLTKRLDLSSSDYREGHAVRYHANGFELAFYDKIREIEQSKISSKRGVEKDNEMQLNFLEQSQFPKQLEVFRYELRIGNRKKMKSTFKKVGIMPKMDFQTLFNKELARRVLRHFWHKEIEPSIKS